MASGERLVFEQAYLDRGSALHNMNLWTKVLSLLVAMPLATFIAAPWALMPISLAFGLLIMMSKVKLRVFWRQVRLYYISVAAAMLILSLAFSTGDLPSRAIAGLVLSVRFAVVIGLGVLFSMVTDPIEIPAGLLKARIPHRYGVVMMIAFRMMPLIADKVTGVVEAQRARGAGLSFSGFGLLGIPSRAMSLMVPLVYSTLEASVGLSDTLIARGYDPKAPTITVPPTHVDKRDLGMLLAFTGLFALTFWWR